MSLIRLGKFRKWVILERPYFNDAAIPMDKAMRWQAITRQKHTFLIEYKHILQNIEFQFYQKTITTFKRSKNPLLFEFIFTFFFVQSRIRKILKKE